MEFSLEIYALFILTGFLAGWVDSIAGSGGLIALPILLAMGVPPDIALGTNKLQSGAGTFTAIVYFVRKGMVNLRELKVGIAFAFVGSILGVATIMYLDTDILKKIIPGLLIFIALYFLFLPSQEITDKKPRISLMVFLITIPFFIAFYDGFFGPGTGSFLIFSMIFFLGFSMPKAVAYTKIFNFTSNAAAIIYFGIAGKIFWTVGFAMIAGQLIGASLGSRMVVKNGAKIIRPLVAILCLVTATKLLLEIFEISVL